MEVLDVDWVLWSHTYQKEKDSWQKKKYRDKISHRLLS